MQKLTIETRKYKGITKPFSFRLPVDLIADIDQLAAQTNRNRNEIVLLLLEYMLAQVEVKEN